MNTRIAVLLLAALLVTTGCKERAAAPAAPSTPEAMYAEAQALLKPSAEREGPDTAGAVRWLTKAAHAGHLQAQIDLGGLYYKGGKGVEADPRKALGWFVKAAEQGDVQVLVFIGEIYYQGYGAERDVKKALEYWNKAAEVGVAEAHYYLGNAMVKGSPDTVLQGVEHLKKAVAGIRGGLAARAATMLASLYWHGHGPLAQDQDAGLHWYRTAAEAGDPPSQLVYGLMLIEGEYVPADVQKGESLLRMAAGQDHLPAIAALINYLRNAADSTPEMQEEAEAWQKRMDDLQGSGR